MPRFQTLIISALLITLPGCANSRLRKDCVGFLKTPFVGQSPFAKKCSKVGDKVGDSVNKVGAKLDDIPLEERCGSALDDVKVQERNVEKSVSDTAQQAGSQAKGAKEQCKDEAGSCLDWAKKKVGCK